MTTLTVRLGTMADTKARSLEAARRAEAGERIVGEHSLAFSSYDDMHKVLTPARLAIVKALAGQGALPIREVVRRVGRHVLTVHRDVTILVNAGVIDRTAEGIQFPYDKIHFEYDVCAAA